MIQLERLKNTEFELSGNTISIFKTTIARVEDDRLVLFINPLSKMAADYKLQYLLELLGYPEAEYKYAEKSDFFKVTSVRAKNSIIEKCRKKYGSLSNALTFAANA